MGTMERWTEVMLTVGFMMSIVVSTLAGTGLAATPELKGKYEILNDEPSTHQRGKVKLIEFADFYCPHCHHFDGEGLPILEKEFGKKLEAAMAA